MGVCWQRRTRESSGLQSACKKSAWQFGWEAEEIDYVANGSPYAALAAIYLPLVNALNHLPAQ
jgi:hypothetical protein